AKPKRLLISRSTRSSISLSSTRHHYPAAATTTAANTTTHCHLSTETPPAPPTPLPSFCNVGVFVWLPSPAAVEIGCLFGGQPPSGRICFGFSIKGAFISWPTSVFGSGFSTRGVRWGSSLKRGWRGAAAAANRGVCLSCRVHSSNIRRVLYGLPKQPYKKGVFARLPRQQPYKKGVFARLPRQHPYKRGCSLGCRTAASKGSVWMNCRDKQQIKGVFVFRFASVRMEQTTLIRCLSSYAYVQAIHPFSSLLGGDKDASLATFPIEESIKKSDGFVGIFPDAYDIELIRLLLICSISVKGKVSCKELKMKHMKGATYMDSYMNANAPSFFIVFFCDYLHCLHRKLIKIFYWCCSGAIRVVLTQHLRLQNNAADISAKEGS
nr:plasma membrane ATPase 4 isoform X1 [Tanacetum cinerariifolium]